MGFKRYERIHLANAANMKINNHTDKATLCFGVAGLFKVIYKCAFDLLYVNEHVALHLPLL